MLKKLFILYLIPQTFAQFLNDIETNESFNDIDGASKTDLISHKSLTRQKRQHGKINESFLWPNATVPLYFDPAAITPQHERQIRDAIRIIENSTCVKFVNYTNEVDFVNVTRNKGGSCKSKVGRRGGQQLVKLVHATGRCTKDAHILHEFIHLLGFHHIHISPNRDSYIKILWENVNPPYTKRFVKRPDSDELSDFETGYDYDSIMHTNLMAYSTNGLPTILTLDPKNRHRIGQRNKLSDGDILRINRMYKCHEISTGFEPLNFFQ